jgi:transcriptional regulator with XRE-family HTH domain
MGTEAKKELRQLGEAIRVARKQMNVSQEDFAESCDLHRTYIGHVERGEVNVSFRNILKIAAALKMKPSVLLDTANL